MSVEDSELDYLDLSEDSRANSPYNLAGTEHYYGRREATGQISITDHPTYVPPSEEWFALEHIASFSVILESQSPTQVGVRVRLYESADGLRFFIRRKDGLALEIERSAIDLTAYKKMKEELVTSGQSAKALGYVFSEAGELISGESNTAILSGDPQTSALFFLGSQETLRGISFFNRSPINATSTTNPTDQTDSIQDRTSLITRREEKVMGYVVDFLRDNPAVLRQLKSYVKNRKQPKE